MEEHRVPPKLLLPVTRNCIGISLSAVAGYFLLGWQGPFFSKSSGSFCKKNGQKVDLLAQKCEP